MKLYSIKTLAAYWDFGLSSDTSSLAMLWVGGGPLPLKVLFPAVS